MSKTDADQFKRVADQFKWVDPAELQKPIDGHATVFVDYWWSINTEGQVALYKGKHPQCNKTEAIARMVTANMGPDMGFAGVRQFPIMFLPLNVRDYD